VATTGPTPKTTPTRKPTGRRNARVCANPVCGTLIERDRLHSMELTQVQAEGPATWAVCDLDCARLFLALSDVKNRAAAEVEP
jgi:hypothetical protein